VYTTSKHSEFTRSPRMLMCGLITWLSPEPLPPGRLPLWQMRGRPRGRTTAPAFCPRIRPLPPDTAPTELAVPALQQYALECGTPEDRLESALSFSRFVNQFNGYLTNAVFPAQIESRNNCHIPKARGFDGKIEKRIVVGGSRHPPSPPPLPCLFYTGNCFNSKKTDKPVLCAMTLEGVP